MHRNSLALHSSLTDDALASLSALGRLSSLSLRNCASLQAGVLICMSKPWNGAIVASMQGRDGGGFEKLLRLSNLASLNLSGCTSLLPEARQVLSRWGALTSLDLHNCPLGGDEGLRQLQGLQHLKKLELGGAYAQLTDAGMHCLVHLRGGGP